MKNGSVLRFGVQMWLAMQKSNLTPSKNDPIQFSKPFHMKLSEILNQSRPVMVFLL